MRTIRIEPRFEDWRFRARELLGSGVRPDSVLWEDGSAGAECLFGEEKAENAATHPPSALTIPRAFLALAELVACHRACERWGILYRVAWRLTHGGERRLLAIRTDDNVKRLEDWASAVRRDRHKMKAFVRFRKTGESIVEHRGSRERREQFVAWFEPEFAIVELTAPFFAKRFAGMDWSILTPFACAHWDGDRLRFTPGVSRSEAPEGDSLEDYWRSYYAHIFNPARLKLKAMQAEMPKKYWSNLPEAALISDLTANASTRALRMVDAPSSARAHVSSRVPRGALQAGESSDKVDPVAVLRRADGLDLGEIRDLADRCRACALCERATQVVHGEGAPNAAIMIVGEQPGDEEDLQGRPFVGPAGQLLNAALSEAGIDRERAYVTNAVKHFKWKRRGKRRLHQTPSADEVHRCRPWLLAEVLKVKPRTLVCLGATAAKSLIRPDFSILGERGLVRDCSLAGRVVATVHPSYLLRLRAGGERERERARWIADLKLAMRPA